jgi:ubiquitin C-terminal hydrolase
MNFKNNRYELFAINIRFGQSTNFGHQICQIKNDNNWYTLNDNNYPTKSSINQYNKNSYGLYYKVIN